MEGEIGQLYEEPGELRGEWRIPNFLSLPEEVDKGYWSPAFFFLDTCWSLRVYPSGETEEQSEGWIGLYLHRLNNDSPVTVNFSMTIRMADKERRFESKETFTNDNWGVGSSKILKRCDLQSEQRAASPSDALAISYTVKSVAQQPSQSTLCNRLWNMSLKWIDILTTDKKTYVVLKLKDGQILADRAILESSSAVFARMFDVDMKESLTGEVNIEDATKGIFQVVLSYVYGGDPTGLSCENMCEVYKVAHKYEFQDLREFCSKFIKNTLSEDTVCDVIALAYLYQETALMESAKDYFAANKNNIFKTEKWKTFKRDNPAVCLEVVESIMSGDI